MRGEYHAPYGKPASSNKIYDIMIPQIDCREDEATYDKEKKLEN